MYINAIKATGGWLNEKTMALDGIQVFAVKPPSDTHPWRCPCQDGIGKKKKTLRAWFKEDPCDLEYDDCDIALEEKAKKEAKKTKTWGTVEEGDESTLNSSLFTNLPLTILIGAGAFVLAIAGTLYCCSSSPE